MGSQCRCKIKVFYGRIIFLSTVILVLFSHLHAKEACKFGYKGDINELNGGTIGVPDKMAAFSEYVKVGPKIILDSFIDTPSIFFIIDNSGSMKSIQDPRDRDGNRFLATAAFIDTIYRYYPRAQVGLAVFGTWLFFDPADRDYFVTCPTVDSGAYVPLLELDKKYVDYGNQTGYQILKEILDTALYTGLYSDYVDLQYQPTDSILMGTSTHINAAFKAAIHSFILSLFPRDNHFVIFLSDGDATYPNDATQDDFQNGVGVPTTFTIYFSRNGVVPASIQTMTENIRNNGYSTTNPLSNYWGYNNTSMEELVRFFVGNIFIHMCHSRRLIPRELTVNGAVTDKWDSTGFTFDHLFPLTGRLTHVNYQVTYSLYTYRNIYVRDSSTREDGFSIDVDSNITGMPDTFDVTCWDRTLDFRFNDQAISQANETMDQLEIQFVNNPQQAAYDYTKATVDITHRIGSARDRETFALTKQGDAFSIAFNRTIASPPVPGNGILEHAQSDTLVAVFRNSESPLLPLDTLLTAIPFIKDSRIKIAHSGNQLPGIFCRKTARGRYSICVNNLPGTGDVRLFCTKGRLIFHKALEKGSTSLTISKPLPSAIYLVKVNYGSHVLNKKFVLQ